MGINAHASHIYVLRVFIHVLHLIDTLEGPATLASSLEVSLEENQKNVDQEREGLSNLHSFSQDLFWYHRRRKHLAIRRKLR
jgi:hypothetical protein